MNFAIKSAIVGFLVLVIYSAYTVYQGAQGFNPPLIDAVKDRIRADYKAKNFEVSDVTMLRRGPRELGGFVVLKSESSSAVERKNCTAALAEDKNNFTCNCQ